MTTEANLQDLFEEGVRLHQSGQLLEAQQCYRNVLQRFPKHADALFLLGTTYLQLNDPQQAVEWIEQARDINPHSASIHLNLANALHALGKKGRAVDHFEKAIELDNSNAEAHFNLAIVLVSQNKYDEAALHYQKAIAINPKHIGAINNLSILLQQHGKHDEAIRHYQYLLSIQPDNVDANYNIANSFQATNQYEIAVTHYKNAINYNANHWLAYHNMGKCLEKMGRHRDAIAAYEIAIALNPNYGETYYLIGRALHLQEKYENAIEYYQHAINLGFSNKVIFFYFGFVLTKTKAYQKAVDAYRSAAEKDKNNPVIYLQLGDAFQLLEQYEEAVDAYKKALQLMPHNEELYNNLGCALGALNYYDQAIACFNKALNLKTNYVEAYNNLGCTLMELNKLDEAVEQFDHAITYKPDYRDAFWNKGLAYLCQGKQQEGWLLYENRPTAVNNKEVLYYKKIIDEAKQYSTTLLIESEQGFGDIIQTLRYINLLIEKQVVCWVKIPEVLISLAERSFPQTHFISSDAQVNNIDNTIALMSLPLVMNTFSESAIPNKTPYLIPDKAKVAKWNQLLSNEEKKRVGLFWRGKRKARNDNRSIDFSVIKSLFANESIEFVVLQKDITTPEFIELKKYNNVTMLDHDLIDFDETAAVMANLDLMISIDSAPVHLAGAIGIKTFALLPFAVDWRWMTDRTDSPWYPDTVLYRQKTAGDWSTVIDEVKQALVDLTSSK